MKKARRLILILSLSLILVGCMLLSTACQNPEDPVDSKDKTYTITVTNGTGGSYQLSEKSPVKENTKVTLTVTPDANYKVKSVKINGSEVTLTENKYVFTVNANTTINIEYQKIPSDVKTYTITVTNGVGGNYTLSQQSPVEENTEVTLTVTPDANYRVKSVKVNDSEVKLTDNKYTFTVSANTVIVIEYVVSSGNKLYEYTEDNFGIYFGEYPQSLVKDTAINNALTTQAGTLPQEGDPGKWTDYEYYLDNYEKAEYMWYIDLEYEDSKYRGVYFTEFRPRDTDNSYRVSGVEDNGYEIETVFWFKFEPIKWRILDDTGDELLLMSDIALDAQEFYPIDGDERDDLEDYTVYPNNYKYSTIRTWLNETFYETAFTEEMQSIINTTTVDNSAATTESPEKNNYVCENTQDKIFLLSYQDAFVNSTYAFKEDDRKIVGSNYADCQGLSYNMGACVWWLRSPSRIDGDYLVQVDCEGKCDTFSDFYCNASAVGVVPALWLSI